MNTGQHAGADHTSGEGPVPDMREGTRRGHDDREQLLQRVKAEHQQRETALGIIRADLVGQPSANCVRTAARRWAQRVHEIADDVVKGRCS